MMRTQLVVAKIGGSLFSQRGLVPSLKTWSERLVAQMTPTHIVFVAGGGPLVDGLREVDRVNPISLEQSHWLAVHLMDVNANLLRHWWPGLPVCSSLPQLQERLQQPGRTLFLVERFLQGEEPRFEGHRLPIGWEVSSDSIAGRLAEIMEADQLILLKSRTAVSEQSWEQAAADGLVDQFFPTLVSGIPLVQIASLTPFSGES